MVAGLRSNCYLQMIQNKWLTQRRSCADYMVSEFGRVCERRKLRVNVGKSHVMRCSRYGNGDRMHVILNGEPLEEVDCFKYLGSQVTADGECERDVVHRMNEGYRAWGTLKSVLSNSGLGIRPRTVYTNQ